MSDDIYILIDRYLAGELSEDELRSFEKRLQDDFQFAEKVHLYEDAAKNLSDKFSNEEGESSLRRSLEKIAEREITYGKRHKVIQLKWYWAAASVAIVAAVFAYSFFNPGYNEFASHDPLLLVERGNSGTTAARAEKAFNDRNYKAALVNLNSLLVSDNQNIELLLSKGICLLELNDFDEAEKVLDTIQNSNSIYREKAIWYMALSALKQEQYDKCKLILRRVPEGAEEFPKAQRLSNRLRFK